MANIIFSFIIPPLVAGITYALVHFQLLFMDKLINMGLHQNMRTRICLWAFFTVLFLSSIIMLFQGVFS